MQQMVNIIYVQEGNVSSPFVVLERLSEFTTMKTPDGCIMIREQLPNRQPAMLVCRRIEDASYEDVLTDEVTEVQKSEPKDGQVVEKSDEVAEK